jgi:hypothetical protein
MRKKQGMELGAEGKRTYLPPSRAGQDRRIGLDRTVPPRTQRGLSHPVPAGNEKPARGGFVSGGSKVTGCRVDATR